MPIFFNVTKAREYLFKFGHVYTLRKKRPEKTAETQARMGGYYKFSDLGRVSVRFIQEWHEKYDLIGYVKESGFDTVSDWVEAAEPGAKYVLQVVRLTEHPPPALVEEIERFARQHKFNEYRQVVKTEKVTNPQGKEFIRVTLDTGDVMHFPLSFIEGTKIWEELSGQSTLKANEKEPMNLRLGPGRFKKGEWVWTCIWCGREGETEWMMEHFKTAHADKGGKQSQVREGWLKIAIQNGYRRREFVNVRDV